MEEQPNRPNSESCAAVPLRDILIVLVEPSHPGDIGGGARAMKTMALGDLAIVRATRFPDETALAALRGVLTHVARALASRRARQ